MYGWCDDMIMCGGWYEVCVSSVSVCVVCTG